MNISDIWVFFGIAKSLGMFMLNREYAIKDFENQGFLACKMSYTPEVTDPTPTPASPHRRFAPQLLPPRNCLQGRGRAAHSEPQENVSTPVLTAEATHASATEDQAPSDAPDIVPPDRQALADIYLAEAALQVAYRRQAQAEALRAYAISFEEEDAAPAQPTIAF